MKKELIDLKQKILDEVYQYLEEEFNIDGDTLTYKDNDKLFEMLDDFLSKSFTDFEEKTDLELMFNVFINKDNIIEVEILEI